MYSLALSLFLSAAGAAWTQSPSSRSRATYRHAYYLFLIGAPKGCEDCYVPLLITKEPLDRIREANKSEECVLIVTYERDSIWHDDGIVSVGADAIEAGPRIIRLRDRRYRYQEISSLEILRILQNPMGSIPISRPLLPNATSPGPTLPELISAFKEIE